MADQPNPTGDPFVCAAGSDIPAAGIYDPKRRCPMCGHAAIAHNPDFNGTCDVCSAVRITVNYLATALKERGVDLYTAPPQEGGGPVEKEDLTAGLQE